MVAAHKDSSYNSYPSYTPSYASTGSSSSNRGGGGSSGRSMKPRWSRAGSSVYYTPAEVRTLTPVRENIEKRITVPDLRDVFLCHAWDDRNGAAKELHDLLEARGVSVWFSAGRERRTTLGLPYSEKLIKDLRSLELALVLVTPAFLKRLDGAGIAEKGAFCIPFSS